MTPGQVLCGHEHEYGGVAYRCERKPHPVDGHEERHRHAARIDAGYAREIGDVDGEGTPDLITWDGDEPGDGENTEVAWGTVEDYGAGECAAPGQADEIFPCCPHCIDGDGMRPCGEVHDEPCGTGDCGLVTDAELAEWRKGLQP